MKRLIWCLAVLVGALVFGGTARADIIGLGANQFTLDFVPISGSTNPTDTTLTFGCGIVNHDYRMGKYEITNAQWNMFTAAYGTVTGSEHYAYDRSPSYTGTNVPTNNVSWYEAAQFVNWLNTSTGHQAAYKFTGTQGTGDYTFAAWAHDDPGYDVNNQYRNSNAMYYLPTVHEWVKAAYWNGMTLQAYANASAGDLVSGEPDGAKWNYLYEPHPGQPWAVGSGSQELNGTYDMMGNVWEWMETPATSAYFASSSRGLYGGSFGYGSLDLAATSKFISPTHDDDNFGFRVASSEAVPEPPVVPEPASLLVWSLLGASGVVVQRWRRFRFLRR